MPPARKSLGAQLRHAAKDDPTSIQPSLLRSLARPVERAQLPPWAARVRERLGVVEAQIRRLEREKQLLLSRLAEAPADVADTVLLDLETEQNAGVHSGSSASATQLAWRAASGQPQSLWEAASGYSTETLFRCCDGSALHPALAAPARPARSPCTEDVTMVEVSVAEQNERPSEVPVLVGDRAAQNVAVGQLTPASIQQVSLTRGHAEAQDVIAEQPMLERVQEASLTRGSNEAQHETSGQPMLESVQEVLPTRDSNEAQHRDAGQSALVNIQDGSLTRDGNGTPDETSKQSTPASMQESSPSRGSNEAQVGTAGQQSLVNVQVVSLTRGNDEAQDTTTGQPTLATVQEALLTRGRDEVHDGCAPLARPALTASFAPVVVTGTSPSSASNSPPAFTQAALNTSTVAQPIEALVSAVPSPLRNRIAAALPSKASVSGVVASGHAETEMPGGIAKQPRGVHGRAPRWSHNALRPGADVQVSVPQAQAPAAELAVPPGPAAVESSPSDCSTSPPRDGTAQPGSVRLALDARFGMHTPEDQPKSPTPTEIDEQPDVASADPDDDNATAEATRSVPVDFLQDDAGVAEANNDAGVAVAVPDGLQDGAAVTEANCGAGDPDSVPDDFLKENAAVAEANGGARDPVSVSDDCFQHFAFASEVGQCTSPSDVGLQKPSKGAKALQCESLVPLAGPQDYGILEVQPVQGSLLERIQRRRSQRLSSVTSCSSASDLPSAGQDLAHVPNPKTSGSQPPQQKQHKQQAPPHLVQPLQPLLAQHPVHQQEQAASLQLAAVESSHNLGSNAEHVQGSGSSIAAASRSEVSQLHPEVLSEDALKAWMRFFGMKPVSSTAFMVRKLKEIDAYLATGSMVSSMDQLHETEATMVLAEGSSPTQQHRRPRKRPRPGEDIVEADTQGVQPSQAAAVNRAAKAAAKEAEVEQLLADTIRRDTELYERLLLFESIEISELKARLGALEPELRGFGEQRLKRFLDRQGLVFASSWSGDAAGTLR